MEFEVCGENGLVRAMVATYLGRKYRGSFVTVKDVDPPMPAKGLKVRLVGPNRWLFLGLDWEPGSRVAEAIGLGAAAAITLSDPEEEFDKALNALTTSNTVYISEPAARWLATTVMRNQQTERVNGTGHTQVTPRERQILECLRQGATNDQIARALTISTNTVRTHLHSLAMKLETSSRSALVHRATAMGIFEDEPEGDPLRFRSA